MLMSAIRRLRDRWRVRRERIARLNASRNVPGDIGRDMRVEMTSHKRQRWRDTK
jgi:hypothetical protein